MSRISAVGLAAAAFFSFAAQRSSLDRDGEQWVARTLQKMTLDQKIGQMLVPGFEPTYLSSDTDVFQRLAGFIRDQHVGGFITTGGSQLASGALLNPAYTSPVSGEPLAAAATFNRLQSLSTIPLLNSSDFEWGVGTGIEGATSFPSAMAFGAAGDDRLIADAARVTAIEGRAIGVHVNIGPVADVNSNARNPVMRTRAFGETPAVVSTMVTNYVRSLQANGMLAALKHFPGHGDTAAGVDIGLPVLAHPRARLDAVELSPFRAGIAAGAAGVMTSHIVTPALDSQPHTPATFSAATTQLLRSDLAFSGLVFTDSMKSEALRRIGAPRYAAVRAVKAGHDMLVDLPDPAAAFDAIKAAVQSGEIEEARVTASAERILRAKARLGLHKQKLVSLDAVAEKVGGRVNRAVAQVVNERAITLLKDDFKVVPLRIPSTATVLYLSVLDDAAAWGIAPLSRTMIPEVRKRWRRVTAVELSDRTSASELALVVATARRHMAIIASVFVGDDTDRARTKLTAPIVQALTEISRRAPFENIPVVMVFFGNPYAATSIPGLPTMMLTYDVSELAELSAVRAIAGEIAVGGRLPVELPGLFPLGHGLTREALRTSASLR